MDISRALRYPFDDPQWVQKLTITAVLTAASILLMPFLLLGLVPFCVLLGYMLQVINNVRDGKRQPLPDWTRYEEHLSRGAGVLLGLFFYNLPLLLIGGCGLIMPSLFGDSLMSGFMTLITLCCLLPLGLLYIAFAWPVMAVGVIRYARGRPTNIFFQTGRLWATASALGTDSAAWLLVTIIINLVFTILLIIPCVGWMLYAGLLIPVHAHLLGQYARRIDRFERAKPLQRPAPSH
jgi:hypothetical protein